MNRNRWYYNVRKSGVPSAPYEKRNIKNHSEENRKGPSDPDDMHYKEASRWAREILAQFVVMDAKWGDSVEWIKH